MIHRRTLPMAEQNTVFISYRRDTSKYQARSIYQALKLYSFDVFLDVTTMDGGDLDHLILNQIGARAHFILLISDGSLKRCAEQENDWVLREIEEAVRLNRNIVPIIEEGTNMKQELSYLPARLREIIGRKSGLPLIHFYFDAGIDTLRTRFLKIPPYIEVQSIPLIEQAEVQRRIEMLDTVTMPRLSSNLLMPAPFGWIEIPNKQHSMAKYPVTNAQFAKFIEAGGYNQRKWWTPEGWKYRKKGWHFDGRWKPSGEPWRKPRFWDDSGWNGRDQPVVGVSWFESVAFCLWLSGVTGEKIMLPTEKQWQYAAQGDDNHIFPWGNQWDCERCNNSVKPCHHEGTTPVTHYEDTGNSPFGVVDMVGNVQEWCLTDYNRRTNDIESKAVNRTLRGGSWDDSNIPNFRCDNRDRYLPNLADRHKGFRLAKAHD